MTTVSEFQTLLFLKYPGVKPKTVTDAETERTEMFIQDAINELESEVTFLGSNYDSMVLLHAAHFLTEGSAGESNSGTVVEEEDTNGKRIRYLSPSVQRFGELGTTKYGRMFEAKYNRLKQQKRNSTLTIYTI